jgi:hypothetical protein
MEMSVRLNNTAGAFMEYFDFGLTKRYAFYLILFVLLLNAINSPDLFYIVLAFWGMKGSKESIMAISLLTLIVILNNYRLSFGGSARVLWWIALMSCSIRIIIDAIRHRVLSHPVLPWLFLFTVIVSFQSIFSSNIAISLAKILSFSTVAISLLLGFKLTIIRSVDWTSWFLGLWIAILLLSIPAFIFTDIGYFRDPGGFQGALAHPQLLGIFFAPCISWLIARSFFSSLNSNRLLLFMTAVSIFFVYHSKARTSLAAIIMSFSLIGFMSLFVVRSWSRFIPRFTLWVVFIFGTLVFVGLGTIVRTQGGLVDFLDKGSESTNVNEALKKSRGSIIEESWNNFIENPIFGIGFGITKNEYFTPQIDARSGLPVSAATEKALLPVVLLEEVGLVGTFSFIPFFFMLLRSSSETSDLLMPMVFASSLFINIGEMVFFSVGGVGLYLLMLIFWSANARYIRCQQAELSNVL